MEVRNDMDEMEYKAMRFDSIFYLKDFLNDHNITPQEIIGIFRKDNGLMELLYLAEKE